METILAFLIAVLFLVPLWFLVRMAEEPTLTPTEESSNLGGRARGAG